MQVLKFGGSSVASGGNMLQVVAIVEKAVTTSPVVLVVSALGGITDQLLLTGEWASQNNEQYKEQLLQMEQKHLDAVRQLLPIQDQSATLSWVKQQFNALENICEGISLLGEWSPRTKDRLVSHGELLSSYIMAAACRARGLAPTWLDCRELIVTDDRFGHATVQVDATYGRIAAAIQQTPAQLYVAPGFIAANALGQTTTLGRGGSDYTAALFAAALNAAALEIWTDVSGMKTADPRLVQQPKDIERISYQEAMELSHFGAKIIYPPTIQPVMQKNIPVWVKNTFEPGAAGTLIEKEVASNGDLIRGISSINNISLLSLEGSGMVGIPGFSKRLFETLAHQYINVVLITQSSSEHSICVAINGAEQEKAQKAIDACFAHEIETGKLDPVQVEGQLSIVAVVGEQMKSMPGISGKMFGALGRNGINVRAIAQGSSEKNISAVLRGTDVRKAINVLHEAFFETTYKQLNVFVAGAGNVGGKLLGQLQQQWAYLKEHLRLQIQVVGIANSKANLIDPQGIDLTQWKTLLAQAPAGDIQSFCRQAIDLNLRNTVFVDVTAHAAVAAVYDGLLEKNIAVVACNKIAASDHYSRYKKLKQLSRIHNAPYLFETNVGAGLPVIGTLNDLVRSGDKINTIQAVLSGTLNFVFNHYDGTQSFSSVVRKAQAEGYTEPDPRLDLGGTDVMRKIMILAREAGAVLEMDEIDNQSFLPESCFAGSVEDFYAAMEKEEAHFQALLKGAKDQGAKLKFVAEFKAGKAKVGLQHIAPDSDFYHLYGKDNLVLFFTDRYPEQPLVVKGAGAGADVTASGVFADIIRVAR